MPNPLEGKNIVLGVTGSIACYKAVDLASKLTQEGALVDVIMTRRATKSPAPRPFGRLTHRPAGADSRSGGCGRRWSRRRWRSLPR